MEGESSDSDDSFVSNVSSFLASSPDDSSAVIVISSDSVSGDSNQSTEYFSSSSDSSSDSDSNMSSSSSDNSSVGSTSSNHSDETRMQMVTNFTSQIPIYLSDLVPPEREPDTSNSSSISEAAVQNTDTETPPPPSVGDAIVPQDDPQPGPSSAPSTSSQATKSAVKRPASSMDAGGSDDDEDQRCPICLDSWSGTGEHRLCSLACGHLFGKSCIERWLKKGAAGKRCPKCNHPCKKGDIRPLFATAVKVKETSGEEKLQQQLQQALKEKRELELQIIKQQMQLASMQKKDKVPEQLPVTTPVPAVGAGKYMFRLAKEVPLGDKGGGRIMSYCPWATHLSVSRASKLCGYGLMHVYCERNFITHLMESLHGKMIRDMAHFPDERNSMLLTASLDRSAKLVDFRCNLAVQTYRTTAPLWSCCWDMTGSAQDCHLVSLGMTSGEIARFDIRKVSVDPVATLNKRGSTMDQSPVSSLVSLPAGYCSSLPRGGLIVTQLTTCRLYVGEEDLEGTVLPFQAPFLSVRSEGITGHLLVSTRASNGRPTNHTVFRISREHNTLPAQLFEPVLSLQGANRQSLMTRPCIAALGDEDLIVSANQEESRTVPIWSVSTAAQIGSLPTAEDVLDICNISVNNKNFLGLLTDKKLSIYEFQI